MFMHPSIQIGSVVMLDRQFVGEVERINDDSVDVSLSNGAVLSVAPGRVSLPYSSAFRDLGFAVANRCMLPS